MVGPLVFDKQFDPKTGQLVVIAPGIARVTAPNANDYTFTGTNTFLVGRERLAVIDPGPDDPNHLRALLGAIGERPVDAILLTHTHRDHSGLARRLADEFRAPLWFGGKHRLSRPLRLLESNPLRHSSDWTLVPDRILVERDTIAAGDLNLSVHETPGHCANHLAFGMGSILLSGDHVMGWNSTLVAVPDGSMGDYLRSLDKVIALPFQSYLPAHGGIIHRGPSYASSLKAHREMRNGQVVAAVRQGARSISAIVDTIYPQQPWRVRRAARMTITAHVEYLADKGLIDFSPMPWGARIRA